MKVEPLQTSTIIWQLTVSDSTTVSNKGIQQSEIQSKKLIHTGMLSTYLRITAFHFVLMLQEVEQRARSQQIWREVSMAAKKYSSFFSCPSCIHFL